MLLVMLFVFRAFCSGCSQVRLEHFFSLIFEFILGTKSIFASTSKIVYPLNGFLNCIEGGRWLDLPSDSKVRLPTVSNYSHKIDVKCVSLCTSFMRIKKFGNYWRMFVFWNKMEEIHIN